MAYTLEDEFGDIIGKARRGNGLSVGEVAAGAGLTEAQLSQMEDYTLKPTEDQVHKIAAHLNLNGARLAEIAMERWGPEPVPSGYDDALEVVTITADVGGWPVHAYLLVCKATNEAAIIDTAAHPGDVLQKGGSDRRQADRDSADTCTRRSRERFDGDRTGNRLPHIHPRTGATAA